MKLLTSPRSAVLLLLVIFLVVVASFLTDSLCQGLVCRGDFPAFYAAANLAFSQQLYSATFQQQIQQGAWPALEGAYLYFAYPPYTAVLYWPLGLLSPYTAKIILLLFSLLALTAVVCLISRSRSAKEQNVSNLSPVFLLLLLLILPQNFIGVFSGQNLTLSMLCLGGIIFSSSAKIQGLSAGLWWFKPQFAVFASLGFLFSKNWRALLWSLLPLSLYFLIAVIAQGTDWPLKWISAVTTYSGQEIAVNSSRSISLFSVLNRFCGEATAIVLCVGLLLYLLWCSFRLKGKALLMLWILCGLILSPRTMFYDFGLAALVLIALDTQSKARYVLCFLIALIGAIFGPPLEPLFLCSLLIALYYFVISDQEYVNQEI